MAAVSRPLPRGYDRACPPASPAPELEALLEVSFYLEVSCDRKVILVIAFLLGALKTETCL